MFHVEHPNQKDLLIDKQALELKQIQKRHQFEMEELQNRHQAELEAPPF